MNKKWLALAAELLGLAADRFTTHGCNDLKWPEGWTEEERRDLAVAVEQWNLGKPLAKFTPRELEDMGEPWRADYGPPDWLAMRFLAARLREEAGE